MFIISIFYLLCIKFDPLKYKNIYMINIELMPFRSRAQEAKCWLEYNKAKKQNRIPQWDCEKWEQETKNQGFKQKKSKQGSKQKKSKQESKQKESKQGSKQKKSKQGSKQKRSKQKTKTKTKKQNTK